VPPGRDVLAYGGPRHSLCASAVARRYYNHLNPDINKGPWTPEEDQIIIARQIEYPNKWANIAREVNGRYACGRALPRLRRGDVLWLHVHLRLGSGASLLSCAVVCCRVLSCAVLCCHVLTCAALLSVCLSVCLLAGRTMRSRTGGTRR
jgi:hypothetical protein